MLDEANEKIRKINNFYWKGLVTADERIHDSGLVRCVWD